MVGPINEPINLHGRRHRPPNQRRRLITRLLRHHASSRLPISLAGRTFSDPTAAAAPRTATGMLPGITLPPNTVSDGGRTTPTASGVISAQLTQIDGVASDKGATLQWPASFTSFLLGRRSASAYYDNTSPMLTHQSPIVKIISNTIKTPRCSTHLRESAS